MFCMSAEKNSGKHHFKQPCILLNLLHPSFDFQDAELE